ncbi:MAG: glycosyltransferase [bacterium]|nr:glycosyltransferase [bacterium]
MKMRKIAIVYDWIDKWGGVERILQYIHEAIPEADFYTSYYDIKNAYWAKDINIYSSFLQKMPRFIKKSRMLSLPLYPFAFESFDFSTYDLVLSITSSFAKSIITKPKTRHVCYLLTPTRYLWSHENEYVTSDLLRFLLQPYISYLKKWDYIAAQRPDKIYSISQTVGDRCKKYYQRDSEVIYPPFDFDYWNKIKNNLQSLDNLGNKFFLMVGRLEKYKKNKLIVEAFNRMPDKKLIVIGKGTELAPLKRIALNNTEFITEITDEKLGMYYSQAEALIMPQEEDFGYVSLEAQLFGCPVISYDKGGATETIIENKTGVFFKSQTINTIIETLESFHTISYNLKNNLKNIDADHYMRFGKTKFINNFVDTL